MAEIIELEDQIEKVILVGVSEQDGDDAEDSVAELAELVRTAGAVVVGTLIQKRELMHPGTYVGTGKVAEIAAMIAERGATGIVCDDELSPAQLKNLEQMLDTKVMDRTLIILDIFAARATTSEGKIQVELAQLKYRLSRLTGLGRSMSRLGGGIGTRGPGEKKLEMDRRLIKDRIAQLNRELKEVRQHREITRAKRTRNGMPVAAIVGYTNAGKSTLLKLLMRFWDVNKGNIKISDQNVKEIPTKTLRNTQSYVTQDTELFHDSIANNIAIGKPGAAREEIIKAAQKASIHDMIMSLPNGYDTEVGELGDTLSGGEKQRIGIARAFLHDSPMLLLDEPTSNLDSLNEGIILKSLKEESKGRTVVLVSHRESTMGIADDVYHMDAGRVS